MISGSLLIDKKIGVTSRDEVNHISFLLKEKKAGHVGTLDPFASGLLIVLLGKSTKIAPFLETMDKTYLASLKLGQKTLTGDLTGEVIEEKEVLSLSKEYIKETLESFLGESEQLPPMYSAIKVDGKELYKYAREGKEIERKKRKIFVHSIELLSYENNEITFIAKVSKGTYIRTLGEDIANRLGSIGHLTNLTRIAIGPYSLKDAKKSDEVTIDDLISNEIMLKHLPSYQVEGELLKKALNGMHFRLPIDANLVALKDKEGIIAIYERLPNGVYSPKRGLR